MAKWGRVIFLLVLLWGPVFAILYYLMIGSISDEIIPYDITLDRMKTDLIGKQVTLDDESCYTFTKDEEISLTMIGDEPYKVDDRTMVSVVRIISKRSSTPNEFLDGYLKMRYHLWNEKWRLVEILPKNRLGIYVRK